MKEKKIRKKKKTTQKVFLEHLIYSNTLHDAHFKVFISNIDADIAYSSFTENGIEVHIGTFNGSLQDIISSLIHELFECILYLNGHRFFDSKKDKNLESIACIFIFNHLEFQEMVDEISRVLIDIYPFKLAEYLNFENKSK